MSPAPSTLASTQKGPGDEYPPARFAPLRRAPMRKAYPILALAGLGFGILLVARGPGSRVTQDKAQQLRQSAVLIVEQPREHQDLIIRIGAPLTPFLVDHLQAWEKHENPPFWKLFTRLRHGSPDAIQKSLPEDMPDELRCLNAIRAIAYLGTNAAGAVRALIPFLYDERFAPDAAHALASIGPNASEAAPHLAAMLDDQVPWAATALGNIGQAAVEAIPALEYARSNAIAEGPGWFRREVEKALEKIRDASSRSTERPQSD
ncbi:MAG: hypothetical protein L0Z50_05205 [Verrucomicrobiales bacterium]|nr:hypothetical protein [Verrucomicrobiales bacterium]